MRDGKFRKNLDSFEGNGAERPPKSGLFGSVNMTSIDPNLNTREWATLKRVMPRDVYEELLRFEELVATHSGIPPRFQGIGHSVSVWSIVVHALRNREEELIQLAKEWKSPEQ